MECAGLFGGPLLKKPEQWRTLRLFSADVRSWSTFQDKLALYFPGRFGAPASNHHRFLILPIHLAHRVRNFAYRGIRLHGRQYPRH